MSRNPTVELWILYAVGVSFTFVRTYARIVAVGVRELHPDDYLIWVAVLIYSAQCTLGHSYGTAAHGLANNGMSDVQRGVLSRDDPEYAFRVIGSKIQVAGWTTAACLLWTLKLCVTFFYMRLTNGLERYPMRIRVAMALILSTFIVVLMTIYLSCRPFHHYWQIKPDPGNACQAAISKPILWVSFILNVSTDTYLFLIPIPMLRKSSLRSFKKLATTLVPSGGVLIIVCATLKSIHVIVDPINGGQLAAEWGTRETFIAVVTTNLPMIFPLLKTWFTPLFPSSFRSSNNKAYRNPSSGFRTIGGSGGPSSRVRPGPRSVSHITTNMTFDNGSEGKMMNGSDDVKMQNLCSHGATTHAANAILVSKQVSVTTEKCTGRSRDHSLHSL
ncbi:hypothetical protein HBH56_079100 [Parastagonospora nodorum]|uniref:Rhodopsin domain-containing protein n=1 Tax=Phaeosphaeria nodorum (strain SN15 / ATCC MYA-4574 / FGSC 10173) TaxID=321614 RepID=A0A7U2IC40_PHANO|nr:hypothetical protein HBH56_079100 [Parastagonospora nodorum]QRD07071.1 hypothetical protein JI435_125350 [Parastagonospora nodorum SN15]KAH3923477.1 hypothetical protein HBH54_208860 [Parastagonospora nodorum]KAH4139249.1 hypothetical protein HBH45_095660 [Parastagonospora nodorum]KAH4166292.1 hypothetical protein HBH44_056820 [Parastagonospora nodorum]